jgi:tetratricopeptide (TPR) repeat protein
MACLHERNIPESLLPEMDSKKDAVDALATLKGYSFVTRQTGNEGGINHKALYDMHRLVHLAARNWLRKDGTLRDWKRACIVRLAELFPPRDHQYKDIWTAYLPHAQRLCEDSGIEDLPEQYQLLEKMGLCLFADGKYSEAVKAHAAVVHWRESKLGMSDKATLRAYNNLGEALNWKGDLRGAEIYLQKALQRQKEAVGAEQPTTLTSMGNLPLTYWNQGRWKEAKELQAKDLDICSRVLGAEHPDTLTSMANLALTYRKQGRWKEAEELQAKDLDMFNSWAFLATHRRRRRSCSYLALESFSSWLRTRLCLFDHSCYRWRYSLHVFYALLYRGSGLNQERLWKLKMHCESITWLSTRTKRRGLVERNYG